MKHKKESKEQIQSMQTAVTVAAAASQLVQTAPVVAAAVQQAMQQAYQHQLNNLPHNFLIAKGYN